MNEETKINSESSETSLTPSQKLETFKFYQEASEKTKVHAWTQTAWILTLNAGVIAFSLNLYLDHAKDPAFLVIEFISAGVGIVLCVFLFYALVELGNHIRRFWTYSNRIKADFPPLASLVRKHNALQVNEANNKVKFPMFCRRLQFLAVLFAFAHIGWALFVTIISARHYLLLNFN
jgi:hypothetical protein